MNEHVVKKCVQNSFLYRLGEALAASGNDTTAHMSLPEGMYQ